MESDLLFCGWLATCVGTYSSNCPLGTLSFLTISTSSFLIASTSNKIPSAFVVLLDDGAGLPELADGAVPSVLWVDSSSLSYISHQFFSFFFQPKNDFFFFSFFASSSICFLARSNSSISWRCLSRCCSGSGSSISANSSLRTSQPSWLNKVGIALRYPMCPSTKSVQSKFSTPYMFATGARPATRPRPPLVALNR